MEVRWSSLRPVNSWVASQIDTEGYRTRVENGQDVTDPILLAQLPVLMNGGELSCLSLRCVEAAWNGASVVSPEALGAFFAEIGGPQAYLSIT
jgi:hypothetical protein